MADAAAALQKIARDPDSRRRWLIRLGIVAFLLYPWILPSNWSNMGVRAAIWALALLSLVVLTGWVGQISLAQAAIMGVGAFTAAKVTNHLVLDFPFHAVVAGIAGALVAAGIGIAALRIRGLYLAIATLAFQWMMEASFLEWHPFSGGFNGIGIRPLHISSYDFSSDRLFFYLAWPVAALLFLFAANLRDSKTGRAWFAIRGSELAASSLGIDVMRYKLIGFAVSGFIVGVAGSINLNFIGQATPLDYNFQKSITYLAVAVLGGVGFLGGALVGAFAFVISDQLIFTEIGALRGKIEIAAAALLIFTIIRNPGGLITFREDLVERIRSAREKRGGRREEPLPVSGGAPQQGPRRRTRTTPQAEPSLRQERAERPAVLRVQNATVRFGGVVALDGVSLEVREREICGLIGPNGAGKTTLFNVINGMQTPLRGAVRFLDADVTAVRSHARAKMGLARTFQIMRLFPRLTVTENLMIGTHRTNASGFVGNLLMLDRSRAQDAVGAERVAEMLAFLGIGEVADAKVAGLPFGTLRLVELARALVTDPALLLLDEPASGLDVGETELLVDLLCKIRDQMDKTILLIEHDMSMVMSVSDYVYVMDFGRNLAEGLPVQIRSDEAVIAAYLGGESVA